MPPGYARSIPLTQPSPTPLPGTNHPTPLLDRVRTPADLRRLKRRDLRQLADELRTETIDAVASTGGHLGAGLGVIELTVALHYVFDTPTDRLVWDAVSYTHLTLPTN